MAWRLAESLIQLRNEVNAAAPGRSKASDGTIGDTSHGASNSDHNPNSSGVVCAFDITHDPSRGADCAKWAEQIRLRNHPAWKYTIFNGRIISKGRYGEGWRRYGGSNPHSSHMHVSVGVGSDGNSTGQYDDRSPWGISDGEDDMPLNDNDIARIQKATLGTTMQAWRSPEVEKIITDIVHAELEKHITGGTP